MQLGICTALENAPAAADSGFEYIEINLQEILRPEADDEQFAATLERIRSCGLPVRAANCFIPAQLKITGPNVNMEALMRYVAVALRRAGQAGIEIIVFGSGGARNIPAGFERERAWEQLVKFGSMVAGLAAGNSITIAVEPLNRGESNILNTIEEGARYVRAVNHPSFRLLVDAYHWAREAENPGDLVAAGGLLRHAHIATYANRLPPGAEATDFAPFFAALQQGSYDQRLSVEAGWKDIPGQAPAAVCELRLCLETSRFSNRVVPV